MIVQRLITGIVPLLPKALVGQVAGRYIAGKTREEAILLANGLADQGFVTTVDILGEDVTSMEEARGRADAYLELLKAIASSGIERNISLKLTQLGLRVDSEGAFDLLSGVIERANSLDFFVRIDMEDSTVTDQTLAFFNRIRDKWPAVGTVLQSRLKRTTDDARKLAGTDAHIRLCKGIYPENSTIAYTNHGQINDSFMETLKILLDGGAHVAIATHDPKLLVRVERELTRRSQNDDKFEFQALLGVPFRDTLERLRDAGHTVRLYVPFGSDWYAYGIRRLKENPQMAGQITKSIFSRNRLF